MHVHSSEKTFTNRPKPGMAKPYTVPSNGKKDTPEAIISPGSESNNITTSSNNNNNNNNNLSCHFDSSSKKTMLSPDTDGMKNLDTFTQKFPLATEHLEKSIHNSLMKGEINELTHDMRQFTSGSSYGELVSVSGDSIVPSTPWYAGDGHI